MIRELTPEEQKAIAALKRLAKTWPKSLILWHVPDSSSCNIAIRNDDDNAVLSDFIADYVVGIEIDTGFGGSRAAPRGRGGEG
ncbi:MAG: hypothetical protein WC869_08305 [Phycisphaerae bacterium]|jgi:hypothetical protein